MKRRHGMYLLVFCMIFLSGCSTVSRPGNIPEIKLQDVGCFSRHLSVDLINDQLDATPRVYAGAGGYTYYANYNEWTKFFIDKLSLELGKRGVVVSENSPNKLKLKLSDFVYIEGWGRVRVNMKVSLEIPSKNWKKQWDATDVSGWSMGRAFGSIIYHEIEHILKDQELLGLLQVNEP